MSSTVCHPMENLTRIGICQLHGSARFIDPGHAISVKCPVYINTGSTQHGMMNDRRLGTSSSRRYRKIICRVGSPVNVGDIILSRLGLVAKPLFIDDLNVRV